MVLKILTSKFTGKKALGRPRHTWEEYTRTDLREIDILFEKLISYLRNWYLIWEIDILFEKLIFYLRDLVGSAHGKVYLRAL